MIGQTVGHYRVLEFLGHGESGAVYRAEDMLRHRLVALKILPAPLFRDPTVGRRLESNLNTAAALDHPAIPRIYDLGSDEQFRYVAMQLIEGTTLEAQLRKGALAPEEAVGIAWEVAAALDTAHLAGLIHGDLKAADIVLTPGGVRVHGFGSTHPPAAEQQTGIAKDLWRLGGLLYEMLTGRQPYGRDDLPYPIHSADRAELVLPGALRRGIPQSLDCAVARAVNADAAARPRTAIEFQRSLEGAGTDLNALGLMRAPLTRRRRRHFGLLVPTVASIAFLVIVWFLWQAMRWELRGN